MAGRMFLQHLSHWLGCEPRGPSWSMFFKVSVCPSASGCSSDPELPDPGFETWLIPRMTHPEAVREDCSGGRLGLDRSHPL